MSTASSTTICKNSYFIYLPQDFLERKRETHQDTKFLLSNLNLRKDSIVEIDLTKCCYSVSLQENFFLGGPGRWKSILTYSRQFTMCKQLCCDHMKSVIVLPHTARIVKCSLFIVRRCWFLVIYAYISDFFPLFLNKHTSYLKTEPSNCTFLILELVPQSTDTAPPFSTWSQAKCQPKQVFSFTPWEKKNRITA